MRKKIKIIAEAGVNHNGSLAKAKKLIDVASRVGANYVKFQTFEAEDLVTKSAPKAMYQKSEGLKKESQFCMLKKLELSKKNHLILIKYQVLIGIQNLFLQILVMKVVK